MSKLDVLVVAEHVRGGLREVTHELVGAAAELGGSTALAVIAKDPARFTENANRAGVDEIVHVPVEQEEFESDVYGQALAALIEARRPDAVLLGFTVNSLGYAPAVAARLGLGFASDVHGLSVEDGRLVAVRSFYGGKVNAELELSDDRPALLLLRPTAWAPVEAPGSARVSELPVEISPSRARHRSFVELEEEADVDITTADFLLSIGRGVGDRESIPELESLARRMGATLAASRPLVDAGWMPSSRQVGQSGKTVRAKVYLAFGISGAAQHLTGMKNCGTIIAVNTDAEAAIFKASHYGAVADLFEVAEELEKLY